jgi:TolB protein
MVLHCQDLGDGYYILPDPYADVETSDLQAAWSSDGEWICYRHEDYGLTDTSYPTGLYIMKADGTSRYLIVPGEAFTPDWSNDGEWIAFFSGAIHILKVGTDSISSLTPFAAFFPSWSPNDNRLVFDTSYEDPQGAHAIWIIGRAGENLTDISDHGTGEWRSADWSPDGSTIVHYRYIGVGAQEIFTMDTLGENSMRLTYNSVEDFRPRWSPEGTQIAWWLRMGLANEVWVMNEDGTNQQKLTDGTYPNWSPDSKSVMFSNVNPAGDRVVLWTIRPDGSDLTQLTF